MPKYGQCFKCYLADVRPKWQASIFTYCKAFFWYNLELANWGAHAQLAVACTHFCSSHMLYLTSQSTTLSKFWCYKVLAMKKIIAT